MLPPRDELDDVALLDRRRFRSRAAPREIAGPLATASRQPTLPHEQSTSAPCGRRDVAEVAGRATAPRCSRPPLMMPAPMPVATLTKRRCSTSGWAMACSPRAMMLTSLSTSTGHVEGAARRGRARRSRPSPGMIGGRIGRPVECSTGPGSPMPTPMRSSAGAAGLRRAAGAVVAATQSSTDLGAVGDVEALADLAERTRRAGR